MKTLIIIATGLAIATNPSSAVQPNENVNVETNRPDINTFAKNDSAELYITKSISNKNSVIHLSIVNEKNYPILNKDFGDNYFTKNNSKLIVNLPTDKYGFYKVYVSSSTGASIQSQGTRPAGFISYMVTPNPDDRHDYGATLSRFGLQGPMSASLPVLPYLGVRYVLRGVMDDWAREEKTPGQFNSSAGELNDPNRDIEFNAKYQSKEWHLYPIVKLVGSIAPRWAFSRFQEGNACQFGPLTPVGRDQIINYASRLSAKFAKTRPNDAVHYYQITWEPFIGHCFLGTPEDLLDIYKLTYSKIHENDHNAVIAGPTLNLSSDSTSQIKSLVDAGLSRYIDVLSIHAYNPSGSEESTFPPEDSNIIDQLNYQLNYIKSSNHKISNFIDTEHSFRADELGDLKKAEGDIRVSIIMLGEGAALDFGFYLYDFWGGDDIKKNKGYGFYWNLDGANYNAKHISPKPVAAAFSAMTWILDGSTSRGSVSGLTGTQRGYRFFRNGVNINVVWDYKTVSRYIVNQKFSKVCNWMANCVKYTGQEIKIGPDPTYLIDS